MQVYHGSYTAIDRIDLSKCIPNKDFGQEIYEMLKQEISNIYDIRQ